MKEIFCNDVLGMTVEEAEQLDLEEVKQLLTVNVITPNGENVELYYSPIDRENTLYYLYPISQNGNYTFKATNSKGRSSGITVPVKIDETKTKTFTLEISETETKTFSFIEGQTWNDFIGENDEANIDGVRFKKDSPHITIEQNPTTGYIQKSIKVASLNLNTIKIGKVTAVTYWLLFIDGENKTLVSPTDKIVADGVYSRDTRK